MEQVALDRIPRPAVARAGLDATTWLESETNWDLDDPTGPVDSVGPVLVRAILDHVHFGVAVVGPQLQLLFLNHAARRECARHQVLRIERERLVLVLPCQAEFMAALVAARRGRWSLVRMKHGDGMMLAVAPLSPTASASDQPVLVVFGQRSPCKALAMQFYAQSCGMTSAETRVLRALGDGLSPREIADQHEVALSTVRTQLGSIRSKAGACNLRELIRILGCLPPIMPATPGAT